MSDATTWTVEPVEFVVSGATIRGDLYRPETRQSPPVVVMAHGFGAQRVFVLPEYAERFAAAGMAVLLFDYRGFGDSGGEPRALVDPRRHLEDCAAAVGHVRQLPGIDASRVALWGTSFGGGHVLVLAARMEGIAAVVAQVPPVDGMASAMRYPPSLLPKATAAALRDLRAARRGDEPVRVPIVARSGVRCLAGSDCYEGYWSLVPPGMTVDDVPARILLEIEFYRPIRHAHRIAAPTMIIGAEHDTLIPIGRVRRTAARISSVRLEVLPLGHFDLYHGEPFAQTVAMETSFLSATLGGSPA